MKNMKTEKISKSNKMRINWNEKRCGERGKGRGERKKKDCFHY